MPPKLPSRSASVEEVRRYVAEVLESEQSPSPDHANSIADQWQIGRGSILRDANLEDLKQIFGINAGLCVFQYLREGEDKEWHASYNGIICNGK